MSGAPAASVARRGARWSDQLTCPAQQSASPFELDRENAEADRDHDEGRSRQYEQGEPDPHHRRAHDCDDQLSHGANASLGYSFHLVWPPAGDPSRAVRARVPREHRRLSPVGRRAICRRGPRIGLRSRARPGFTTPAHARCVLGSCGRHPHNRADHSRWRSDGDRRPRSRWHDSRRNPAGRRVRSS